MECGAFFKRRLGFLHLVHQGFGEVLVADLGLVHLPMVPRACFGRPSALRFHLPMKRKYNLCVNLKLSGFATKLDFFTCLCVSGVHTNT